MRSATRILLLVGVSGGCGSGSEPELGGTTAADTTGDADTTVPTSTETSSETTASTTAPADTGSDSTTGTHADSDTGSDTGSGGDVPGTPLWTEYYGDPVQHECGNGIDTDADGNIVVVGYTRIEGQVDDVWVRKYDPDGAEIWTRTHDGELSSFDTGLAVGVHEGGDIVVLGLVDGEGWLRGYDPDGAERFTTTIAFEPISAVVDGDGNAFVSGRSGSADEHAGWVGKYSPLGEELWLRTRDLPNSSVRIADIDADAAGNVVAVADIDNGASTNFWVWKWLANGDFAWELTPSGYAAAVAITDDGIVAVASDLGVDGWYGRLYAIDDDGGWLWEGEFDAGAEVDDWPRAAAGGIDGDIVVAGDLQVDDHPDAFLRMHESDGAERWLQTHGAPDVDDHANAVAVDPAGDVVVTGCEWRMLDGNSSTDIWVAKYAR